MSKIRTVLLACAAALLLSGAALAQNAAFQNYSAATSSSTSTPTQLIPALSSPVGFRRVMIRVEGAAVVCFSAFNKAQTATGGQLGTFCLKGGTAAGDGLGGTYETPPGMSDPNEIWMVSGTASVPVTAWAN
jgi:hypothetical protein